jgi:hypothetical protein
VAEGESRILLRGLSSETYGLGEYRRHRRAADREDASAPKQESAVTA